MTNSDDIKILIREQLPSILAEDASIRDFILRTVSEYYSPKQETDQKFEEFKERVDRILAELQQDREEQAQKWAENNHRLDEFIHEQAQKWEENNRQWEENNRQWQQQNQKWWEQNRKNQETLEEIKQMNRKYNSTIGALGSRWGLFSEASFRNALAGILEKSFGVEVVNINDYDADGMVFGRPDQVEVDVIIKNGLVIVCEIKSSMSKGDMYIFSRKAEFYQQKYQRNVNRKIVISPMVDPKALPVAETLGIEVYSYVDSVSLEN
ncbi:MAG: DUF3782 domain-containing protein [Crocosphaera sp.]|nr:DUF3782 domain-containing protein [Crocosphaera sp.]